MRLTLKLTLALALVVLTGVGVAALLASRSTGDELNSYMRARSRVYESLVVQSLTDYYSRQNSWSGAAEMLAGLRRAPEDRLVLLDPSGRVIADTAGAGSAVPATEPVVVVVGGQTVGKVVVQADSSATARMGGGFGRGPNTTSGPAQGMGAGQQGSTRVSGVQPGFAGQAQTLEEAFAANLRQSLWVSAAVAGVLAVALGALLSWQMLRPIRGLSRAAERIAAGDLGARVRSTATDEFGQLSNTFDQMAESLEQNERTRRDLFADVAHELRTPLTVIEGTAEAIMDGVFEASPDRLQTIRDEASRLTQIVADLRQLSVAEAGQLRLEIVSTDAAELARRAVRASEINARTREVSLTADPAADLPLVPADSERMLQVLANLLGNAIRHTPAGGYVRLEVRAVALAGEDGVEFAVVDSGEGVPAEDLPHVFDRFYRVDRSRSRQSGGTGLGLAIARQFVEAHGGRMAAESHPGQGSRFTAWLPARTKPLSAATWHGLPPVARQ